MKFKRPKEYVHMGNGSARLRKAIRATIRTQADLDVFLGGLPEQMRPGALERARPHLSFEPRQFPTGAREDEGLAPEDFIQVGQIEDEQKSHEASATCVD